MTIRTKTMPTRSRLHQLLSPSLSFVLLLVVFAALWIAGGASRADVIAQSLVRATAAGTLVIAILFTRRFELRGALPVFCFLLAAIALVLLQLIPLPPAMWQSLPGRDILAQAVVGIQPWRPLSVAPDASVNAVASLLIPLAVLVLMTSLDCDERNRLPAVALILIVASMLIGLLQFSGARIDFRLINDVSGQVSGTFANRNHFALFLALGCLIAPVWAFQGDSISKWRGPLAFGLVLVFVLAILGTGSRAGIVAGVLGVGLGLLLVRRRARRRMPRWALPAFVVAVAALILISVGADRATSIHRAITLDAAEDTRARAMPTVLAMIRDYFPAGTGFGTFDPVFRMHEPFELLKPTYFNHAHNDFLEIALDGGLPALVLLLAAIGWWAYASFRVWRSASPDATLSRLGSAMLLLIFIASAFDYPARTPMIMAMIVLAAAWLSWGAKELGGRSPLPKDGEHL